MLYKDAFKTATRSLTHSKTRTALTMLGIIIGIASVIILMSIGKSAQELILNQVQGIGSNLVIITPGAPADGGFSAPASAQGIIITSLQQRDIDALEREPSVSGVAGQVSGQAEAVYNGNNKTVSYQGVTSDYFSVRTLEIGKGREISKTDIDSGNNVAVIGPKLADTLFGKNIDPINKNIRLKNVSLRVVGVLEKGGTGAFGVDEGNLIIIPLSIAQKELLGISYFNVILVQANPAYEIDFVKSRITSVFRQNHGIIDKTKDDFTIQTQEDILSLLGNITSILTLFLAAIASISLIVGGIGIMNIMLVAVTERTREIGLRKAVGATDRDILQQFLIESILLTLLGGVVGIAVGAAVVGTIYIVATTFFATGWVFAFPISAVVLGVGVSTFAGLVFGIYPARQAGRKNPIDALRYE
jgi:putative ABC transport system permease protein